MGSLHYRLRQGKELQLPTGEVIKKGQYPQMTKARYEISKARYEISKAPSLRILESWFRYVMLGIQVPVNKK